MDVPYTGQELDIDAPLAQAYEADPESPIKIRIQPAVYTRKAEGGASYISWRHVIWGVQAVDYAEAVQFRQAMQIFMDRIKAYGPGWVFARLLELVKVGPGPIEPAMHEDEEP